MTKPGRNELCPCGSGKKYKKCHGAATNNMTAAVSSATSYLLRPLSSRRPSSEQLPRPCGDCSLCCDGWVKTQVLGHDIDLDKPCPFSSGQHCTMHDTRPDDPCRVFFCGWAEPESELPDWMKPDQSGVIVLSGRVSWAGRPVDVLVSAGKDPDKKLLDWYHEYSTKNLRPFIYESQQQWFAFGPKEFQQVVSQRLANGELLFL